MNKQYSPQLLSLSKASKQLDISLRSLYRLIASGELPQPVKVGRSSKLLESDLQDYFEKLQSLRS